MELLVGHANGLSRLQALDAAPVLLPDPATGAGSAVAALARDPAGSLWAATARGAARVGPDDALTLLGPGERPETETPLAAVEAGISGLLHFGGAAGLFRLDPVRGSWHVFRGGATDETVPDWAPWDPPRTLCPTTRRSSCAP
jgi:ligand-binding sensor domain-containing protein